MDNKLFIKIASAAPQTWGNYVLISNPDGKTSTIMDRMYWDDYLAQQSRLSGLNYKLIGYSDNIGDLEKISNSIGRKPLQMMPSWGNPILNRYNSSYAKGTGYQSPADFVDRNPYFTTREGYNNFKNNSVTSSTGSTYVPYSWMGQEYNGLKTTSDRLRATESQAYNVGQKATNKQEKDDAWLNYMRAKSERSHFVGQQIQREQAYRKAWEQQQIQAAREQHELRSQRFSMLPEDAKRNIRAIRERGDAAQIKALDKDLENYYSANTSNYDASGNYTGGFDESFNAMKNNYGVKNVAGGGQTFTSDYNAAARAHAEREKAKAAELEKAKASASAHAVNKITNVFNGVNGTNVAPNRQYYANGKVPYANGKEPMSQGKTMPPPPFYLRNPSDPANNYLSSQSNTSQSKHLFTANSNKGSTKPFNKKPVSKVS